MQGASKPVSHISRTMTSLSSSSLSFMRSAKALRCCLVVWCLASFAPSDDAAVITTLITPLFRSSECHSGLSLMISSYRSAAMRRDIATIMPLPAKTSCRASKWLTISLAIFRMRFSLPTKASTCVHLALAFWVSVSSS